MKNILFLDFDGVVNVPWWKNENGVWKSDYNFPSDGLVNNTQAVQWVSEFCEKHNYDIVISSTWRKGLSIEKLQELLDNSGLRKGIKVVGKTPQEDWKERGCEISLWLAKHPEVKNYIIFDDDEDMGTHIDRLVKTRGDVGFMLDDFCRAEMIHSAFNMK